MKYFFQLGKNPALSLAEIRSTLPQLSDLRIVNQEILLAESRETIDAMKLAALLGGTIKVGEIIADDLPLYSAELFEAIKTMLKPSEGKFKFGISNYNRFASPSKDKALALRIKNYLKEKDVSCRWVVGKETVLTSVIVEQNLLKGNGLEIVLFGDYKHCLLGRTLAVQDFKGLSLRDYGRPSRDDHSGMLPPKLARIMLNLAQCKSSSSVYDPFCGSGTIINEALFSGCSPIIGSDISEQAISDTRDNAVWLKRKLGLPETDLALFVADAAKPNPDIKPASLDAIVTEPYLGPQRGNPDPAKVQRELGQLYSRSIATLKRYLKPGGRLVMVWPVRVTDAKKIYIQAELAGFKQVSFLSESEKKDFRKDLSMRGNLLYGREGQRVWREIVVLEN